MLCSIGEWSPDGLRVHNRGRREGFFCDDVNAFLDPAITWRDVGATHDPLSNAAQRELVATGTILPWAPERPVLGSVR